MPFLIVFFWFALALTIAIQSADASLLPPAESSSASLAGSLTTNVGPDPLRTATNSSDNCLTGLAGSLVTVLDAEPDLAGYCYGEDAVNGWIGVSFEPIELRYDTLGSDDLPSSTDIFVGTVGVATIVFPPAYVGTHFGMIYRGHVYCGTVTEEDIYFTAVPEPSTVGLAMGVVALGARHAGRRRRVNSRGRPVIRSAGNSSSRGSDRPSLDPGTRSRALAK